MICFISFLLALIVLLAAWIFKLMVKVEMLDEENTNLLRRIVELEEEEGRLRRMAEERKRGIRAAGLRLADSLNKVKDML